MRTDLARFEKLKKQISLCREAKDPQNAHRIFEAVLQGPYCKDRCVANLLVDLFGACGSVERAREIFEGIERPNAYSWNIMLKVYTQNDKIEKAQKLFNAMPGRNLVSWNAMLSAIACQRELHEAHNLFVKMPQNNVVSQTTLLSAYFSAGEIHQAKMCFDGMNERTEITWNTMIEGHAQNGYTEEAAQLLYKIPQGNVLLLWTAMISSHGRNRDAQGAKAMFDIAPIKNHMTWSAMLAMNAMNGLIHDVKKTFRSMPARDRCSWMCFAQVLCLAGEVNEALTELFQMPFNKTVVEWTMMVNACSKVGDVAGARKMYDQMNEPDTAAVNVMLSAYARGGCLSAASFLYDRAKEENKVDLISNNIMILARSLSGSCDGARSQLEGLTNKDIHSWTALIQGSYLNGLGRRGLQAYNEMLLDGVLPNKVTLISVLNAAGCPAESKKIFTGMASDFGISPTIQHFDCMVGLLGKVKRLAEATELIESMPYEPDARMWMTLLACCKNHGDLSYGEYCAQQLLELEPANATAHVMLGEMYQNAGRVKEFLALKRAVRGKGLSKLMSCSWIQIGDEVHKFVVGSQSHSCIERVYEEVERLTELIRGGGDEKKRERRAGIHSEMLAAAYGMLRGGDIFITNNLKMCGECHEWAKLVSGAVNRKIVVRDRQHLHHFLNGSCSCGD